MGSYPSYDPSVLSRPITNARYKQLFGEAAGSPLLQPRNRRLVSDGLDVQADHGARGAVDGAHHAVDVIDDTGCIKIGADHEERCNAGRAATARSTCAPRSRGSSDVYFYLLGSRLNGEPDQPLQRWARKLGLGRTTGIDLPGESGGLIPDRAWRAEVNQREERWEKKTGKPCCMYSDKRPWTVGDEVGLAIGQGDLQATPLQMAVAYGAIANGGGSCDRTSASRSRTPTGASCSASSRALAAEDRLRRRRAQAILDGLHNATIDGTSADVFKGWHQDRYPVYGKTGTAQRNNRPGDQSWYVAFVPDAKRPIVVAVTVEDGGFGAEAAAPVARLILVQVVRPAQPSFVRGSSRTTDGAAAHHDPLADADDAPVAAPPPAGLRLPFDPLLVLAVLGLAACSLVTIATRRATTSPATRSTTSSARRSSSASAAVAGGGPLAPGLLAAARGAATSSTAS